MPSQTYASRPESPALEDAVGKVIATTLKRLIESCYLYQKLPVDLSGLEQPIDEALEFYRKQAVSEKGKADPYLELTPEKLNQLKKEVTIRQWIPETRHLGDDDMTVEVMRTARIGAHARGKKQEDLHLRFYLSSVELMCPRCRRASLFMAHVASKESYASPFPRRGEKGLEQVFKIIYRCEGCREMLYTVLIRREGIKLHLCGFAPRREPLPTKKVDAAFVGILSDAEQAIAEKDVFGAFYHLRTLLEHILKRRLGLPIDDKIRGDDLIARHHTSLPDAWKSVLPPLASAHSTLSANLHARKGKAEDFTNLRDVICDHFEMLAMFERRAP